MAAFRITGAHGGVMPKVPNWCDEAAVVHWTRQFSGPKLTVIARDLTTRSHLNWPNPIQQAFLDKSRVESIQQRIYLCDQCPCLRF